MCNALDERQYETPPIAGGLMCSISYRIPAIP